MLEYNAVNGHVQNWYCYGLGPDEVLNKMQVTAGTRETLIPDVQGSMVGQLHAAGSVTKFGYRAFGENATLSSGSYRYTARRFDGVTAGSTSHPSGLCYYRARIYSPTLGRFLQPDPIGYQSGGNLYAYVDNHPLNNPDPDGTFCIPCVVEAKYSTSGRPSLTSQQTRALRELPPQGIDYRVITTTQEDVTAVAGVAGGTAGAFVGAGIGASIGSGK